MEKFIKGVRNQEDRKKVNLSLNNKALRSALIGGGIIVGLGIIAYFFGGKTEVQVKTGVSSKAVERTVAEVVKPIYSQMQETKKEQAQLKEQLKALNETLKQLNESIQKQKETKEEKNENTDELLKNLLSSGKIKQGKKVELPPIEKKPILHHKTTIVEEKKRSFGYSYTRVETVKKKKKSKPSVYIPAGSIVESRLMYSFIAPEKGILPPVLIELEKPIRTPNNFFIPLEKCMIITQAKYDISQGVAVLGGRGSTLSCVLKDGKVVEEPVNVAIGEEVKEGEVLIGLKGKEKWLTGKDLAQITSIYSATGFSQGMKESLVQQNTTVSGAITTAIKDRGLYSVLSGVNVGINKFAEFWMRKYESRYPAIEVRNTKRIFVLFVNGVSLGVEEKEL